MLPMSAQKKANNEKELKIKEKYKALHRNKFLFCTN